ncbi:replication initiator protein A [Sphingobium sp. B11D3A]|uniref:replication initiator protein A n=1 Tax=Sphingobium sp. B11D3A TaxID=2940574 RepID=UPI002224CF13|nr:replication initiator protein A [Sphingobium sp. B11D3A]MCW2393582.1 plasmid replication initiation protein [Sphingobium sp. B11D3A]
MAAKQGDLFVFDSPLHGDVRGERSIMAFPFFALTKIAQMKPIEFHSNNVSIEVRPSTMGVATIYDKEIVLYIASLMIAKIQEGLPVGQDFTFTAHDFFRVTGTSQSKRSYQRLNEALERLQGTQIRTNIETGGEGEEGYFSWLPEARLSYTRGRSGERRLKAVKVRLCDWLYRAIRMDQRILSYHHDYFSLGPIERRVYELARSHCGDDDVWEVEIEALRHQVGSNDTAPRFKHALKRIAEADELPEYRLIITDIVDSAPTAPGRRKAVRTLVSVRPRQDRSRSPAMLLQTRLAPAH